MSIRTSDRGGLRAALLAGICTVSVAGVRAQDDFVPLFDGTDLSGWHNVNCAPSTWTVEDGMIVCSGFPTGVLRTDRQYENFILELEWRHLKPGGNSGVFVWSDPVTARGQPYSRGIEVQVLDGREGGWFTSDGDVFPIHGATMVPDNGREGMRAFPTEKHAKPSPEWNHYRVECQDGRIRLAVNGVFVTSGSKCDPRKGYICLESEGSPVQFRNIVLKELPSDGVLEAEHTADVATGWRSLYNGADFAGWKHGTEHDGHWTVSDWRMSFDGRGPDLWSEESFGDFMLICDWRWAGEATPTERPVILANGDYDLDDAGVQKTVEVADAGDSGIYLRGSSKSQVNMWCWPIGSGEVYGYRTDANMPAGVRAAVTPKKVADAPLGQWNRFVVTMLGDRLTVVLNGETVIESAELPGVPESGPIALQNHGAPLQFANIYVKDLDPDALVGVWKGVTANARTWTLTLREGGTATWDLGRSAFEVGYRFTPTATPLALDLFGFDRGPLQGMTLFGIVERNGDRLRWDAEPSPLGGDGVGRRPTSFRPRYACSGEALAEWPRPRRRSCRRSCCWPEVRPPSCSYWSRS